MSDDPRTCKECNVEFVRRGNARYCGMECRKAADKRRNGWASKSPEWKIAKIAATALRQKINRARRSEIDRKHYLEKIKTDPVRMARRKELKQKYRAKNAEATRKYKAGKKAMASLNALVGVTDETPWDPAFVRAIKRR